MVVDFFFDDEVVFLAVVFFLVVELVFFLGVVFFLVVAFLFFFLYALHAAFLLRQF